MVVLSCADETKITSALLCSALFLTASQTHAVTQPHSACLLAFVSLGPSAYVFLTLLLYSNIPLFNLKEKLWSRHTSTTFIKMLCCKPPSSPVCFFKLRPTQEGQNLCECTSTALISCINICAPMLVLLEY
ncbi:hypothetical protein ATANTOWER_000996 [Ataeniobius toweri]|uniref:Uncharacterized protein n=1 Tax=Ataeniobius toweri TaxID=208326 RepID=A0ABU7AVW0_9TELE|nr:hypothetical protein [Ataeniobius toweri]